MRSLPSSPSASAYLRRKLLTYVRPGSRSHSSFSSARRYLARIFVSASSSEMSIRARMRASRRLCPISGIGQVNLVATLFRVVGNGHRFGRRPGGIPLPQVLDEPLGVALADEDLARLGALVAGDDAAALEHVDQAPRARVAKSQAPLEHRRRGGLHLGDEAD